MTLLFMTTIKLQFKPIKINKLGKENPTVLPTVGPLYLSFSETFYIPIARCKIVAKRLQAMWFNHM